MTPRYAYRTLYNNEPGGRLTDRGDVYDAEFASTRTRSMLQEAAASGCVAVVWRAPVEPQKTWTAWKWERWCAFIKSGAEIKKLDPKAAPIKPQKHLDK
jgi:hypothetical protein